MSCKALNLLKVRKRNLDEIFMKEVMAITSQLIQKKESLKKINPKNGKHLGEYNFDLIKTGNPDPSGRHDLKLK